MRDRVLDCGVPLNNPYTREKNVVIKGKKKKKNLCKYRSMKLCSRDPCYFPGRHMHACTIISSHIKMPNDFGIRAELKEKGEKQDIRTTE